MNALLIAVGVSTVIYLGFAYRIASMIYPVAVKPSRFGAALVGLAWPALLLGVCLVNFVHWARGIRT